MLFFKPIARKNTTAAICTTKRRRGCEGRCKLGKQAGARQNANLSRHFTANVHYFGYLKLVGLADAQDAHEHELKDATAVPFMSNDVTKNKMFWCPS